ncbi:MAG: hypothetical protein JO332_04690 [Planctomycetaceae bacterium]|nr:hypothetical protein [Planctomycetaceae bacterium]
MRESSKIHDSKIKKSILTARKVKIWFWDTQREYTGEAVALTSGELTALLKMGGGAVTTMVPSTAVMEGLIRHLTGRVVEFKVTGQGAEVALKGTITEIQRDFENPRRLLLLAKFQNTSEKNQLILNRLGAGLPQP